MKKKTTNMLKIMCIVVISHGLLCVTMSYIMAWLGKADTLETLSGVIASEVVAPIVTYAFSKTIENVFQKNKLSFSEPIDISCKCGREKAEG